MASDLLQGTLFQFALLWKLFPAPAETSLHTAAVEALPDAWRPDAEDFICYTNHDTRNLAARSTMSSPP